MEKSSKERTFICKYCNKKFPSGKSLGGHIRIHTNEYSVDSHSYNNNNNDDKRLVNHREIVLALRQQQQQQHCCGQGFDSLKALCAHMDSHSQRDKKMVIEGSDSESFGDESSSSDSEIDQEHRNMALSLMMMSRDRKGYSLMMKSLILETKPSSREKIFNGDSLSDSDSSDSDYFVNGPKKSDSETGFESAFNKSLKRFRSIEELGVEMSKSKRVLLSSYETDSCDSKIHRTTTSDSKSSSVLLKKSKGHGHECPICFRVFSSGQALGGHKRSHSFENQEHNKKKKKKSIHQVTECIMTKSISILFLWISMNDLLLLLYILCFI